MLRRPQRASVRRKRLIRAFAALAVLLGLAGYLVVQYVTGGPGAPRCTVQPEGGGEPYELSPEQAANAATISAVGASRDLPERAVTIALATAMQESGLRNIEYGDRDSVGLFQQRPSQDWGTAEEIMDPVYAAGEFYKHLAQVPGYSRLPLTVAAQKVQRSAYPQAYAKHEANAALLTGALTGRTPAALSCAQSRPAENAPGDTAQVRERLVREFGPEVLPRTAAATRAAGRTLTVPVTAAAGVAADQRGWQLATWAVAHASELRIERISYGDRRWTAEESGKGWQKVTGDSRGIRPTDVRITTAH
ncbi:heavy metal transporter [Streptomyces olivaceiscleroticus]|uniref:Heavy metal transporter n=1 Tax=Streptomyces olivaceiscleroticus TaxID=68245 RepID=A0ABP3JSB9_9ACTN